VSRFSAKTCTEGSPSIAEIFSTARGFKATAVPEPLATRSLKLAVFIVDIELPNFQYMKREQTEVKVSHYRYRRSRVYEL